MMLCGLLSACNFVSKDFVPGEYVSYAEGNYSIADDTLVIKALEGKRYGVIRKTGFNLIRDGVKGVRQHETENWTVLYDEKTGVLTEVRTGKILVLYPDSNMLMIGKRIYRKIN